MTQTSDHSSNPSHSIAEPLAIADITWIAERIHDYRDVLRTHPTWECRIKDVIGVLVWSVSVDGKVGGVIRKDGWIPSGGRLKELHFKNVPHTAKALEALATGDLKKIKREHVVPRDALREILLRTTNIDDSVRVLKAYSIIALVHEKETENLKPSKTMPEGWDREVDWARTPLQADLPSPWARYAMAKEPIIPKYYDGRPAF